MRAEDKLGLVKTINKMKKKGSYNRENLCISHCVVCLLQQQKMVLTYRAPTYQGSQQPYTIIHTNLN